MTADERPTNDSRWLERTAAAMAELGFDLVGPERAPGDSAGHLLVAIRPRPSEKHFDPESIEFWTTDGSRGHPAKIDPGARFPVAADLAWGSITLTDRLGVHNEFLTFGGTVNARPTQDGTILSDFASPAPFMRSSGHSIEHDPVAAEVEAFFARLKIPIDFVPGSETLICRTPPLVLYCVFVQGIGDRLARSPGLRNANQWLVEWCAHETARMEKAPDGNWAAAAEFRTRLTALEAAARG
jgi:hypothetical protein